MPPPDTRMLKETYMGRGKGLVVEYIIRNQCQTLLELGVFLGASIDFWFNACPSLERIVAVDKWAKGWAGTHCRNARYSDKFLLDLPQESVNFLNSESGLYHTFLRNMQPFYKKIIPMRMDIKDATAIILDSDFRPDVVYLDADKQYETLEHTWLSFHETSMVCGDDYRWRMPPHNRQVMKENLDRLTQEYGLTLKILEDTWILEQSD